MPAQDSMYWRGRLEDALRASGAGEFGYGWSEPARQARFAFQLGGHQFAITWELPDREADEFTRTQVRRQRLSDARQEQLYEQAVRDGWKVIALLVEAKVAAVHSGVVKAESEFSPYLLRSPIAMIPGGDDAAAPERAR